MGWRGFIRSLESAGRAAERDRRGRENALHRSHQKVDRIVDGIDQEAARDIDKVVELEKKILDRPLTASGVTYDRETDKWTFKRIEDTTGELRWSLNITFGSDGIDASHVVVDGPRQFRLLAIAATRWAVFAAFEVARSNVDGKKTKLFTKTNPSKNRVFMIVDGNRYQAIEGQLDNDLFGPHPEVALVGFPLPGVVAQTATVGFSLSSGPAEIPVCFHDETLFQNAPGSLVESLRNHLDSEVEKVRRSGAETKKRIKKNLQSSGGCLVVIAGMMACSVLAGGLVWMASFG